MSAIQKISDEPKYTIKAVSALTGILPVTLRAWERRHAVLSPHRSENRYRLYSERDVAILQWLKNRVEEGITISGAVGELRLALEKNTWSQSTPAVSVVQPRKPQMTAKSYSKQLYQALTQHNEARSKNILAEVTASFDVLTLFNDVINPCLVEIGEAWFEGRIRVATEHFSSLQIRAHLLSMYQGISVRRGKAYIIMGCGPNEEHEIGSLMLAILLKLKDYRVEYLGADIPLEDLVEFSQQEHPNMIILSASTENSAQPLRKMRALLAGMRVKPLFGYGGRAFNFNPALRREMGGVFLGESLGAAVEQVGLMLKDEKPFPVRKRMEV